MSRVIVCDDHALMRAALQATVKCCLPEAEIVALSNFADCWAAAETPADLCLCDLAMPGASPREGIERLLEIQPGLRVIVISGSAEMSLMKEIFALGVRGAITKVTDGAVVEAAIRLVLAGGRYVSPEMLEAEEIAPAATPSRETPLSAGLTRTQLEVMHHLLDGRTNKEIAKLMAVAPSTINSHLDQIFRRLGASNRTEACNRFRTLNGQ